MKFTGISETPLRLNLLQLKLKKKKKKRPMNCPTDADLVIFATDLFITAAMFSKMWLLKYLFS